MPLPLSRAKDEAPSAIRKLEYIFEHSGLLDAHRPSFRGALRLGMERTGTHKESPCNDLRRGDARATGTFMGIAKVGGWFWSVAPAGPAPSHVLFSFFRFLASRIIYQQTTNLAVCNPVTDTASATIAPSTKVGGANERRAPGAWWKRVEKAIGGRTRRVLLLRGVFGLRANDRLPSLALHMRGSLAAECLPQVISTTWSAEHQHRHACYARGAEAGGRKVHSRPSRAPRFVGDGCNARPLGWQSTARCWEKTY